MMEFHDDGGTIQSHVEAFIFVTNHIPTIEAGVSHDTPSPRAKRGKGLTQGSNSGSFPDMCFV